jgi:hypothetical protein
MSRPSNSAADVPRLLQKLSSGNARDAVEAVKALDALAAASQAGAPRLAQADALPALLRAFRSPNATIAARACGMLPLVACAAPDLVADAASSTLVAVLREEDGLAAAAAALVRAAPAMQHPVPTGTSDVAEAIMSQVRHTHSSHTHTHACTALKHPTDFRWRC